MKRIGIFLGVEPSAGGVFQYTQSILNALAALPVEQFSVTAAYVSPVWLPYLNVNALRRLQLPGGKWGLRLAKAMMAARLPGAVCRSVAPWINPLARGLVSADCDLWIFPAQDALNYQVPVPVLSTVHDLMHRYEGRFPEVSAYGRRAFRDHWFRSTVHWATGILVDSEVGKKQVVESYGSDVGGRVYALPYVAPRHERNSGAVNDFDDRYDLPKKFLFYPAQFWPHKNHTSLITAASILRREFPDIHLVLCGSKKNGFGDVMQHVGVLKMTRHVTVTGYVPDADIPEFYRRARAMVMPTFFGPTNIPPVEAFASGCPVAVSKVYGMPEQAGNAALYFDPNSVDDIANCMRKLWQDDELCRELREKGLVRAAEWGQPQFNEVFRKIMTSIVCDPLQ